MYPYLNMEIRIMKRNVKEYEKLLNILKKVANKESKKGNYAIIIEYKKLAIDFVNKLNKCENALLSNSLSEIIDLNSKFIHMQLYLSELIKKIKHKEYTIRASDIDYINFCRDIYLKKLSDFEVENNNISFHEQEEVIGKQQK